MLHSLPVSDAIGPAGVRGPDYFLHPDLDIAGIVLPIEAKEASGMLSQRERQAFYRLVRDRFTGAGFIVDGGMFLGSSAAALSAGLRANPRCSEILASDLFRGRKPVVGFELGFFPGPHPGEVTYGRATIRAGESFVPQLMDSIASYADLVEARIGDLLDARWPVSDPIEVCFIDVAKTPELNRHVFTQFFPRLIPGVSYVIQQDYFFDRLPWIKVLMGSLADHFEWLGQVGPSSIYRYVKRIPEEAFATDPWRECDGPTRIALHRRAMDGRLSDRRKFSLDVSLSYLINEVDGLAAARRHLVYCEERYAAHIKAAVKGFSAANRVARAREEIERVARQRRPRWREMLTAPLAWLRNLSRSKDDAGASHH
jgi:hypothetical protein